MSFQLETAYIGLESPDPARIGAYLTDVIGLMPAEPLADGSLAWRVDGKAHRVFARQGARADAICTGFEARDERAFDRICTSLRGAGATLTEGDAATLRARRVRALVRCDTPWRVPLEVVLGLEQARTPFASAAFPNGFVTQGQGFGHFVFAVNDKADYEAARHLALQGLGMGLSDWLRMPLGPGAEMHVSFLHCNPRHHSLAIALVPAPELPQRLHHVNFEVSQVVDVGTAFERALRSGTRITNTMGQHANDRMVSFYSASPDGWQVEIGATGKVVHEDWTGAQEYDRISEWGHQPPQVLGELLGVAAA
ncbi:VOC family protein [Ramlibacter sp. AW1]|uniref:VOC family protein n=1 Tax=Ramlibacter aurantiacus TaxID=2801330 RepID=A0A936ZKL6_9BURK|nr:VOC family protein [Ramlibacter aurantiacus]MBL0421933.1 VOC family protein [Ramlibacter aurantiacus]